MGGAKLAIRVDPNPNPSPPNSNPLPPCPSHHVKSPLPMFNFKTQTRPTENYTKLIPEYSKLDMSVARYY